LDIEFLDSEAALSPLDQRLGDLIGAIGSPTFEGTMLDFATQEMNCSHLTAFASCDRRPPRVLMAIDRGKNLARRTATKYIRDYWEFDPANKILQDEPRFGSGATIRLRYEEIENTSYRRDCYRLVHLVDRFSIVKAQGNDLVRLNFYRDNTRGRFSDDELKPLSRLANLLFQIVVKHDQLRPSLSEEDRYELYFSRLSAFSHYLSFREIQVCVEIVMGRSSEAIAAKLGLSINTILTHRKRAYSKLSISSQNELSRIVLQ
jgi:DNA-binding CsgD family transcriptional regulator